MTALIIIASIAIILTILVVYAYILHHISKGIYRLFDMIEDVQKYFN